MCEREIEINSEGYIEMEMRCKLKKNVIFKAVITKNGVTLRARPNNILDQPLHTTNQQLQNIQLKFK